MSTIYQHCKCGRRVSRATCLCGENVAPIREGEPPPLPIDQLIEIKQSTGEVTDSGREAIQRVLSDSGLPLLPDSFDYQWLVTKGQYAGTFPKRVAKHLKREYRLANNKAVSIIGDIARNNTPRNVTYCIDFVHHAGWTAGDYGESSNSCWFVGSEYGGCRDSLINAGGGAMRFYANAAQYGSECGIGRAWVMPLEDHPIWLIFNAYGLKLCNAARLMADILGLTYHKVELRNDDWFLNSSIAYAIGAWDDIGAISKVVTNHAVERYYECDDCGENCDNTTHACGNDICNDCLGSYASCDNCGEYEHTDYTTIVGGDDRYCRDCATRYATECRRCNEYHLDDNIIAVDDHSYCEGCVDDLGIGQCIQCGDFTEDIMEVDGENYCESCGNQAAHIIAESEVAHANVD